MSDAIETFQFDDFFVPEQDEGVEEIIEMEDVNGNVRQVPIRIKRGLSLGDTAEARSHATRTHLSPKGELIVDSFDETDFAIELLVRIIKHWPFTKDGKLMPITRANLRAMNARSTNSFTPLIQKLMSDKREALAPFENPSDARS